MLAQDEGILQFEKTAYEKKKNSDIFSIDYSGSERIAIEVYLASHMCRSIDCMYRMHTAKLNVWQIC